MKSYRVPNKLFMIVMVFALIFPFTVEAAGYTTVEDTYANIGVVQCPKYLNIRKRPSTDSTVLGLIKNNGVCEVKQEGADWCLVQSGGIMGYVQKSYLLTGDAGYAKAKQIAVPRIKFVQPSIVYSSMNINSKIWERPVTGVIYDIAKDTGTWVQIDLDGATGYVLDDEKFERFYGLDEATRTYDAKTLDGDRGDLVRYAMQFLGNPYVWGGTNPNTGADCSGYVQYVYKNVLGISMPRVSYEQCYNGKRISSLEMRPGDLIFYADSGGTVGHVAMYIGNGTIVHAASAKSGIKLSPWNYRTPKYIRSLLED